MSIWELGMEDNQTGKEFSESVTLYKIVHLLSNASLDDMVIHAMHFYHGPINFRLFRKQIRM